MIRHRILTHFVLGTVALAAAVFLVSHSFSAGEAVNPEPRAQALHVSRDGGRSWNPLTDG